MAAPSRPNIILILADNMGFSDLGCMGSEIATPNIDRMDQGFGKLLAALKRLDIADETLVLFLSDNGGCAEFMAADGWAQSYPTVLANGRRVRPGNRPDLSPGDGLTFMSYDLPWANVSNAPFRLFKH